jgi:hypothetical protein
MGENDTAAVQQQPAPTPKPAPAASEGPVVTLELDGSRGWFGTRHNEHPDEAYTLATGPDSPGG